MKKIYRPLLKSSNWILTLLLGLLGITVVACSADEYGTPYATYTIKGKVTNTAGNAIPGIEIKSVVEYEKEWIQSNQLDYPYQTHTDKNGEYQLNISHGSPSDYTIYATDIDGELNGIYQPDSALIKGSEIKLSGGDKHWYRGKGEATANFTLKEEKPAEGE